MRGCAIRPVPPSSMAGAPQRQMLRVRRGLKPSLRGALRRHRDATETSSRVHEALTARSTPCTSRAAAARRSTAAPTRCASATRLVAPAVACRYALATDRRGADLDLVVGTVRLLRESSASRARRGVTGATRCVRGGRTGERRELARCRAAEHRHGSLPARLHHLPLVYFGRAADVRGPRVGTSRGRDPTRQLCPARTRSRDLRRCRQLRLERSLPLQRVPHLRDE